MRTSSLKPNSVLSGRRRLPEMISKVRSLFRARQEEANLREVLEDYIEDLKEEDPHLVASHERLLISNILKLRDLTVVDVMIPRADIAAIDLGTSQSDLLALLSQRQFSRFPVYRDTMDDVVGTIHIKDILSLLATGREIVIRDLIRDVPIVSPSLPVLDFMLKMKQIRKHMALVVDEYGGIDGLVTIGDALEAIVGEIEDEHYQDQSAQITEKDDGSVLADARVDIETFEEKFGHLLSEDDREEADTLGGLVFSLAGRVPARGEVIQHDSGMVFEILDADPRKITRLRIRNIPRAG